VSKETKVEIQGAGKPGETEDLGGLSKADREARERADLEKQERSRRGLPEQDPAQHPGQKPAPDKG
jgi:hypothetical protein